jgi:nucleoside-diphosphate kinase
MVEQSLVLCKPDTVSRGLVGQIITRFENIGLKIKAIKMVWPDDNLAKEHYPLDEEWAKNVYNKTKEVYDKIGKELPYEDHMDMGKTIQEWNSKFITEGPVIAMVLEGPHAVEVIREMLGATEPRQAAPGTIRGDFAKLESYKLADEKTRTTRNMVHASDSVENAKREIEIWFTPEELHEYPKDMDKHF